MTRRALIACLLTVMSGPAMTRAETALQANNDILFQQLQAAHHLSGAQLDRIKQIFAQSARIGQGNPAVTQHPMTPAQCAAHVPGGPASYSNPTFERICGGKYLAPLYDPATQRPEDAKVCIDQFEYPNIPCTYPVVWVKADEAAQICAAMGERICDAHEWEGACAGQLLPPDYRFDLARGVSEDAAVQRMRAAHNAKYAPTQSWSYGPTYKTGVCAADSSKSPGCPGGSFTQCGSNTYPSGSFPDCKSSLGVYDINGNAAEHMNLPLAPDEMSSGNGRELGVTEMKGSWFIFDKYRAHPDWCRWRAPFWHGTDVMSPNSHSNYQLGFRCCKTLN
ncbi:hypothetical protein GALL_495380 [mine drainage metagenome]|uniref:Sulfatase-modifying factor enzyme-like domain-containing protein n=1 Tax=mine drainage metagenome TaxID=410659 RepID=A0A1J5PDM0_9ZZZZ